MENKEDLSVAEEVTNEENEALHETESNHETEEVVEEDANDELTEMENKVEQLEKQVQEEENKYLRLLADFDNFKRRSAKEQDALNKYKAQSVLVNVLPVLDNFERALQVNAETDEAKSMMEGMDMIYRSLVEALKSEGLAVIEAEGEQFDPNFHQAVMTEKDDEKESGTVLAELQKGYQLKDRVLRPTMVKVNE